MKRMDYVILLLALTGVVSAYFHFWSLNQKADQVIIRAVGQPLKFISLQKDQTLEIQGALGVSRIVVEDGRARFIESPCDSKQCIHAGWLSKSGAFAACLPNGVSILLTAPGGGFDAINF